MIHQSTSMTKMAVVYIYVYILFLSCYYIYIVLESWEKNSLRDKTTVRVLKGLAVRKSQIVGKLEIVKKWILSYLPKVYFHHTTSLEQKYDFIPSSQVICNYDILLPLKWKWTLMFLLICLLLWVMLIPITIQKFFPL